MSDLSILCICGHDRGTHWWGTHDCFQEVHTNKTCQCKAWTRAVDNVGHDPVNKPSHYTRFPGDVQPIDLLEHLTFNLGAAGKYILRAGHKGPAAEDIKKAIWFLERELKRVSK
jgi:hypothetical protein